MDGNHLGFGRNNLDLEELGPEFPGDENAVVRGVVSDAVEDGFGIGAFVVGQQAGKIDPAQHLAGCGRDARDAVGVPDVRVDLAVDVFELVELVTGCP